MTIKTALIENLVNWEGNPREEVSETERNELRASIAARGQLMPLITRPTADGKQEVIAGRTRRNVIQDLLESGEWPADREVMIDERPELVGDDMAALDIAISENIHVAMHPMDQFLAFKRLVDMGKETTEIANAYGVTPRVVEQRLSYAKLNEGARELVKLNKRDLDWASAMTLASAAEQESILDEIAIDVRRYRNGTEVRMRLENDLVSVKHALFDVTKLEDKLVRRDLFSTDEFMHVADFMPLQEEALKTLLDEVKAEGWARVTVQTEREFDRFKYNDGIQDPANGEVVFVRHANGVIQQHRGLKLRSEEVINTIDAEHAEAGEALFGENSGDLNDVRADTSTDAALEQDEKVDMYVEGRKTKQYLATSRAVIIQAQMMRNPKLALAVTIAGLIGQTSARPVEGRLMNDINTLSEDNIAKQVVMEQVNQVADILLNAGIDTTGGYQEMLEGLMKLDEAVLNKIMQVETAKRVRTDLLRVEQMFNAVDAITGNGQPTWAPDRGFLETLSAGSIRTVARDILPERLASRLGKAKSDMVETIAQIADDAVNQGGRLQNHERDTLLAWRPDTLASDFRKASNDVFGENDNDDADETNNSDGFFSAA